jgi:RND family efflux transporter MFP subunit
MRAADFQRKIAQPKVQKLPVGHAIESKAHRSIVESTAVNFVKPLLLLFSSWLLLSSCNTAPGAAATADRNGRGDHSAEATRQVQTTVAEEKGIDQLVVVTGTLAADQEVVLGFKVTGRLADIRVDLGSSVERAQPIARLDTTDFELRVRQADAALQQARVRLGLSGEESDQSVNIEGTAIAKEARAEMDAARSRLERAKQLFDKGLLPKADFDTTNSGYKVAEAKYQDSLEEVRNRQALLAQRRSEIEIARQQLADAVLYAPISGMIRERNASIGQYVAAGTPIVSLVQMHPLRLRTAVPEREARTIRVGQPVRLTVEGSPGNYEGRVARISPSFDEANRTLLVETEVPNASGVLRPGAFARAEVVVASGYRSLIVPAAAVVTFAGIDRVFAVQDGKASEKRIKVGRRIDEGVEVLEGIRSGEQVILNPGNMTDGEKVAVKQ